MGSWLNPRAKARRCSLCSIQYPPFVEVCRICNGETWPMFKTGPDEDWEERVGRELGEGVYLDPKLIAFTRPHPPDVSVPIHFEHDHIWIGHDDLIGVGYQFLEPGSIVFVNERFFELLGYRKATGLWWVQETVTEGAADDLHPAMFTEWKPDA